MKSSLSAVIENSLSHLHAHTHPRIQIMAGHLISSFYAFEILDWVKKYIWQWLFPARLGKCVIFIVAEYNPWYFLTITVKAAFYLWCSARYELQKRPILFFPPRKFPRHQIQYKMELPFLLYIYRDWSIFHWDTFLQTFNKTFLYLWGLFLSFERKIFSQYRYIYFLFVGCLLNSAVSPFSQNKKQ